jgi:hypothetical protein
MPTTSLLPVLSRKFFTAIVWLLSAAVVIGRATLCAQDTKDCLGKIRVKQAAGTSHADFDKVFDRVNVNGASFSCDLFVDAGQARDILESFRYGVLYRDQARFDRAVRYPLNVIVGQISGGSVRKNKIVVHDYKEWLVQASLMTKEQTDEVERSWLGNVTIVGSTGFNPGFIIDNGLVFFSTINSANVRVILIDLSP